MKNGIIVLPVLAIFLTGFLVIDAYEIPSNSSPPPNVNYLGYSLSLDHPNWYMTSTTPIYPFAVPALTPDKDDMKVIAVNYYAFDEDELERQIPIFEIMVYEGGTAESPVGARLILQTDSYQITRINNELHSGDGWQRMVLDQPVELPKNKQIWIAVKRYNGEMLMTYYHHGTNNVDQIGMGTANPHFIKGISNGVVTEGGLYYKHYAVNLEYVIENEQVPVYPEPTLDVSVDGLRFDLIWNQESLDGELPVRYEGEYYVEKDGVIVDPLQNLEKEETGSFEIITNDDGSQTGKYFHIHQHNGVFTHYFYITAVWNDGQELTAFAIADSIPEPEPEPELTLEQRIEILENLISELLERITVLESQ